MKLLELELFAFEPEGCPVFDYAVSLHQQGGVFVGAIENLTEGRFVRINGRNAYMTHSSDEAIRWFLNATSARA